MRIDLPLCDLKTCRIQFDHNCTDKNKYEQCPYGSPWIPCSVAMPTEDDLYRVTVHPDYVCDGDVQVDDFYWHDGKWMYLGIEEREFVFKDVHVPVIAWKPLEEPYKE